MDYFKHHYFAYGSCMDIEGRITRHGYRFHFQRVGIGCLQGFSFSLNKFAREKVAGDNGIIPRKCVKANLVERPSSCSYGILYLVTDQGLEYLDEREGANAGHYRRRMVDIELAGRRVENVITYTACPSYVARGNLPVPEFYAAELLRGSQSLPEHYLKRSFLPEVFGHDWFNSRGQDTHCAEAFHTGLPYSLPGPSYSQQ